MVKLLLVLWMIPNRDWFSFNFDHCIYLIALIIDLVEIIWQYFLTIHYLADILQMAANQETCVDHEQATASTETYKSCASADCDSNVVLNSDDNNIHSNTLGGLNDDAPHFIPVCTSTPNVERPSCKLFESVVAFPRLDETTDSGLGDTLHWTPSLSDAATPSIRETESVGATESESTETCIAATSTPSFDSLTGGDQQQLKHPLEGGVISSTPISQMLVGRQLVFSVERSQNFSDSPVGVSSFPPDFNLHRYSEDSVSTGASAEHPACKDRFFRAHAVWQDDEDTDDEAYFSTSKVVVESPCGTDESSQSADLLQQWDRFFRDFSPSAPDRLIGRKVGVEFVDIIGELDEHNVPATGVIAWLTPYLTPADFVRYFD